MTAAPGSLEAYDRAAVDRHVGWVKRLLFSYFRAEVDGLDQLPDGPFVAVGNHSGATLIPDALVWIAAYNSHERDRPLVALAHDAMFSTYPAPVARALSRVGAVRADRRVALDALARGWAVVVYPGGDYDACRSFTRRHEIVFAGRTGYVELAREAGVPLVPVVSVGGHGTLLCLSDGRWLAERFGLDRRFRLKTFPISLSLPWGLWLGPLPGYLPLPAKIRVRTLPPIDPSRGTVDEVDRRVRRCLQRACDQMVRRQGSWID